MATEVAICCLKRTYLVTANAFWADGLLAKFHHAFRNLDHELLSKLHKVLFPAISMRWETVLLSRSNKECIPQESSPLSEGYMHRLYRGLSRSHNKCCTRDIPRNGECGETFNLG